jgi:tRNA A37 N6-isopentenylltransferase MiaA
MSGNRYDKWAFRRDALDAMEKIWARGGIPIIAGGSSSFSESLIFCKKAPKLLKEQIGAWV